MTRWTRLAAALLAIPTLSLPVLAEERPIELAPGPGRDVLESSCGTCHSLDYVAMNSPFLTGEQWRAEVTKMVQTYGAPIEDADAAVIVDYLAASYGPAKAP